MVTYVIRRLLLMIPTIIGMTMLIFFLIALSPGGIGAALQFSGGGQVDSGSVALQRAYLEDRYGLDSPIIVQYGRWLGRVSPVKFGDRDQVLNGERIRRPRGIEEPPLWTWFADELPDADEPFPDSGGDPFAFEGRTFADDQERSEAVSRVYRRVRGLYSRARAAHLAAVTRFEIAMGDVARQLGEGGAVEDRGQIKPSSARRIGREAFEGEAELYAIAEARATEMLATYDDLLDRSAELEAVFDARVFAQSGLPVIPGVVSLDTPDLGTSFARSQPVGVLIQRALPVTLLLNLVAIPIIYLVAIPSGILAASRQGKLLDVGLGALYVALWSIPVVWAGVLAIGFLADNDYLGAFPVTGLHAVEAEKMTMLPSRDASGAWVRGYLLDTLWHMVLPVACLTYTGFAVLSKQTRAAMLENFNADYVRTAKAKGVSRKDVVFRHVFRNSLLPLITLFVSIFPAMLGGSVVIERIFNIPGMGSLIIEAIILRDRELLLANALIVGIVNMLALLLADILYALADPRISYD
ncbi:MAG: ABC transporter permease [Planctomycetota bacterium]